MVRAKFRVDATSPNSNGESHNIKLSAVIDGSEENKEFFRWTPSGEISLNTINPFVVEEFVVGREYYVDFTKA